MLRRPTSRRNFFRNTENLAHTRSITSALPFDGFQPQAIHVDTSFRSITRLVQKEKRWNPSMAFAHVVVSRNNAVAKQQNQHELGMQTFQEFNMTILLLKNDGYVRISFHGGWQS